MTCFAEFSRKVVGVVLVAGALLAGPAAAQEPVAAPVASTPALEQLLARFAAMSGLSARFREEKRMALLAAPLVSEGTLYFAPKGRLARHITAPAPATVLLTQTAPVFVSGKSAISVLSNAQAQDLEQARLAMAPAVMQLKTLGIDPAAIAGGVAADALTAAAKILDQGKLLGMYPEGTRSPDGKLFATGANAGFSFVPPDQGRYLVSLAVIDDAGASGDQCPHPFVTGVAEMRRQREAGR